MGKKKELASTGERVENLMEFMEDGISFDESDFERDDDRKRSFRPSKKIIPETDPEIQGISKEIFENSQEVGETEIEGEMGQPKSSWSPQESSSSSKTEKSKKIGKKNISTKEKQMDVGKVFTEPEFRPGSTSTNPKSDSFGKNIGSSVLSHKSRKVGEKSMPQGKDEKPGLPIKKKARIVSDGENNHEEGNGVSEDLQGPSQDGISVNHTDNQGNINVTGTSNEAEVSGSTAEKAKIAASTRSPGTNLVFGSSLGRRGWTPNPEYVKAKQQRRSLFHDQRDHCRIWLKKRNTLDPRPDSNFEDVLIQCVADQLWNRRLAMILAIPLNHLPSLSIEDRVTRWADAVIKNLGVGVCWENFMGWCNSTDDLENEPNRERRWAFLAGRVFFYDLTTTVTHRRLSEAGRKQYVYIAQQLLATLWTR